MFKLPFKPNQEQLYTLNCLTLVELQKPTVCPFLKLEKLLTFGAYLYYQNWEIDSFFYHSGMDGYRGLKSIFNFSDLPNTITESIQLIPLDSFKSKIPYVKQLMSKINNLLAPYDSIIFKFSKESMTINVPYEILLLKFFKEILCNPFVTMYIFNWGYDLLKGIIDLMTGLFADNVSQIHIQEFIYLANHFGYNDQYDQLWINECIDNILCQIIRTLDPFNDAELITKLFLIKNGHSIGGDHTLHQKYSKSGLDFTLQSYVDLFPEIDSPLRK